MSRTLLLIWSLFVCALNPTWAQSNCEGAPSDAVLVLPVELSGWMQVGCTESGHVLKPAPGYLWESNTNGRSVTFAAVGAGGIPANLIDGKPVVVSTSGVYLPPLGGKLLSTHDAYFKWSRLTRMEGQLLAAANREVEGQRGSETPYDEGYLFDLLSNQTFEYRLYILVKSGEPHLVLAMYNVPRQPPRRVVLLVRRG